jgi:hypothetical protein
MGFCFPFEIAADKYIYGSVFCIYLLLFQYIYTYIWKTQLMKTASSVCLLQMETEIEVCFTWSANDKCN